MTEVELQALAKRALEGLGLAPHDAAQVARILVMGDLFGHATHGVLRLESYAQRVDAGAIRADAQPLVEEVAPAVVRVDGNGAIGPLTGMRALEAAMQRARAVGVGLALVRNGNHFGAIAPYCWLAAQQGFATLIGSNASTTVAPTGGREERLGNNPLGIGVPRPGGDPVILDMAMSVVARGKIRAAAKRGESIPATWATDRAGRPTTDPAAALEGFLLPFGGYKGYGLALMVDLIAGVLSGAAYLTHVKSWLDEPAEPGNLGHFFLAIDTRKLGSTDWLAQRVEDFAAIVHGTPRADPAQPIWLPGEIEMGNLARHRRDGVEIDAAVRATLERLAARR
ncbi:MAG TPA: Ldh family oxidoreductase [Usitatibacter sp.]|jgi:LDH2 family malate/lactate/ureidoglycolate dehydrogenase|nr:Ldh family oxidoreductase [Usitatibacter sp.]